MDVIGYERIIQLCGRSQQKRAKVSASNALICGKHWTIISEIDGSGNTNAFIDIITGLDGDHWQMGGQSNNPTVASIPMSVSPKAQDYVSDENICNLHLKSARKGKPWSQTKAKNQKLNTIREYLISKIGSNEEQAVFLPEYICKYKISTSPVDLNSWFLPLMKSIYVSVEKKSKILVLLCLVIAKDRLTLSLSNTQIVDGLGISWSTLRKAIHMKDTVRID